jgi:hypothetical protein
MWGPYLSIFSERHQQQNALHSNSRRNQERRAPFPLQRSQCFVLDRYQVNCNLETAKAMRTEKSLVIFHFGT